MFSNGVYRNDKISITNFLLFGDDTTLNMKAFWEAIYTIEQSKRRGGTLYSHVLNFVVFFWLFVKGCLDFLFACIYVNVVG